MHKEKKTKVYTSKSSKKTKKNPFENIIKKIKFVIARAKAGSKQHIIMLVAAGL